MHLLFLIVYHHVLLLTTQILLIAAVAFWRYISPLIIRYFPKLYSMLSDSAINLLHPIQCALYNNVIIKSSSESALSSVFTCCCMINIALLLACIAASMLHACLVIVQVQDNGLAWRVFPQVGGEGNRDFALGNFLFWLIQARQGEHVFRTVVLPSHLR